MSVVEALELSGEVAGEFPRRLVLHGSHGYALARAVGTAVVDTALDAWRHALRRGSHEHSSAHGEAGTQHASSSGMQQVVAESERTCCHSADVCRCAQ